MGRSAPIPQVFPPPARRPHPGRPEADEIEPLPAARRAKGERPQVKRKTLKHNFVCHSVILKRWISAVILRNEIPPPASAVRKEEKVVTIGKTHPEPRQLRERLNDIRRAKNVAAYLL